MNENNFFELIEWFKKNINWVNEVLLGNESHTVNMDGVIKPSISKGMADKFNSLNSLVQGRLSYDTKLALDAAGAPPSGSGLAEVWNDGVTQNNGLYGWSGSEWVKSPLDTIAQFSPLIRQGQGSNAMLGMITAELLGLFFNRDSRQVYRVSNTLSSRPSIVSTFSGWAQPVAFNGKAFDMLWTKLRVEESAGENQPVECRVWSENGTTLALGTGFVNKSDECWIALDTEINDKKVNVGDALYIGFWVSQGAGRLMPYQTTGYTPDLPASQYPTKYTTNAANYDKGNLLNWSNSSSPTSYNQHIQCFSSRSIPENNQYANLPEVKQTVTNLLTTMGEVTKNEWKSIVGVVSPSGGIDDQRPSDNVFGGWACQFNKVAGASFNAINMFSLSVTSASNSWPLAGKFRLEIRENNLSGRLVAYSEYSVGLASSDIYDVTWLLRDPLTHNLVTLTDNELPDVYVISVRGLTLSGGKARCGYSIASMPNFAGSSWYWNNNNNTWSVHSINPSISFEHRLASDPSQFITYDYLGTLHLEETQLYKDWNQCFTRFDRLYFDRSESANNYTPSAGQYRDRPFVGWGVDLNVPMSSFNAVELPDVRQNTNTSESDRWNVIQVVIKDGSLAGTGKVLAIGQAFADPTKHILEGLHIALRNPLTNEPVTITPDLFSQGTVGIGYVAYGQNGTTAPIGEMGGSSESFAGTSWYTTTGTSWSVFSGNPNMAVGLLYLHGLILEPVYRLNADVELPRVDESEKNDRSVTLYVPPACYAVDGLQSNIYFDNLIIPKYELFEWNVNGGVGIQQEERFTYTPAANSTKFDHAMEVMAIDAFHGFEVAKSSFTLRQAASDGGTGVTRNCIFIGDSTTAGGKYTQRIVNLSDSDVMTVNLQGTRGSGNNQHEGRGGWRVAQYNGAGSPFYRFEVAGITTPPNINSTEYEHNGSRFKVQEYQLDGGAGFFNCEWVSGANEPLASGVLTKVFGSGDDSVAFSSWSKTTANPFWNPSTQAFDFSFYMSINAFTMKTNDWVFFHLGINDIFGQSSDYGVESIANQAVKHYNDMLASIWAYQPGIRIGMMITIPPAYYQSAFGNNYKNGQTRARYKRNIQLWNRIMMNEFGGREDEANAIYLVPVNLNVSPIHGFPRGESAAHSHTTEKVERWTNGVHPSDEGYNQMGDAIWSFLKYHE